MKTISTKSITDAFKFFEDEKDEVINTYNEQLINKQEYLLQFAADTVNAFFQSEEDIENGFYDVFYYLSLFIKSFENEGCEIKPITIEQLEDLDNVFPTFLEEYYEDGDPNTILSFVNQPFLIDYLLMELSDDNEDNEFDDNESNLIFMAGLSFIYLLNNAQK